MLTRHLKRLIRLRLRDYESQLNKRKKLVLKLLPINSESKMKPPE